MIRCGLIQTRPIGHSIPTFGSWRRAISATSSAWAKKMPDRPKPIKEEEFTEAFLKGSGPGGQKINKTSSAVQLKHISTGLVLKVQATRSRTQNRKIARQILADRLEEMEKGKESRAAVLRDTKRKKKSSAMKKSRRKYRALVEVKAGESTGLKGSCSSGGSEAASGE